LPRSRVGRKAGLRRIRIHDRRHTYASLLIGQGESLAYVKEQMGNHSIRVTVDTYGHLVPGGSKAAVHRLDAPVVATIRNRDATTVAVAPVEGRQVREVEPRGVEPPDL
jgi:hypothetical protein